MGPIEVDASDRFVTSPLIEFIALSYQGVAFKENATIAPTCDTHKLLLPLEDPSPEPYLHLRGY